MHAETRGYDANKKIKGKKHHLPVDTWACCWWRGSARQMYRIGMQPVPCCHRLPSNSLHS
ncbi:Transposase (IS4 family) [Stigmatella aurantiaca DW4/3-1]|uniref:Transposase (IS4 family) n=1 Tax=Stigmatella aurantiaca (strain DW4/3-1) TaxID=378806 RepID=E3FU89_STIAD|nr:Transposase (IS4 family) [Stigmatella aurantiaca DW4/3-1]